MTTIFGKNLFSTQALRVAVLFSFTSLVVSSDPVQAQMPDVSTDFVKIDLSVINNSGPQSPSSFYFSNRVPQRSLLLPSSTAPTSKLHIVVPKAAGIIKLKKPGIKRTTPRKQIIRDTKKKPYLKQAKIIKKPGKYSLFLILFIE